MATTDDPDGVRARLQAAQLRALVAERSFEAALEVGGVLAGTTDVGTVLQLVADRCRTLVGARLAVLATADGDELVVERVSGDGAEAVAGLRIPVSEAITASALWSGRTVRVHDVPDGSIMGDVLGVRQALAAPMRHDGAAVGVLVVLDRETGDAVYTVREQRLLEGFAAFAAVAVTAMRAASSEALRRSVEASEAERRRWARELHDGTLQDLATARFLLAAAKAGEAEPVVGEAIRILEGGIGGLRALIADLRPPALDTFGVAAALAELADRTAVVTGLDVRVECAIGGDDVRLEEATEEAVYRVVQEALTNVAKHARATRAVVDVHVDGEQVFILVTDDGIGAGAAERGGGFGLLGMRERLALLGGALELRAEPGRGTQVQARLPARRRG